MLDLSLGGARIATALPPPLGTEVEVFFDCDGGPGVVQARATVVWRAEGFQGRGGLMGVEFITVSDSGALQRFVSQG